MLHIRLAVCARISFALLFIALNAAARSAPGSDTLVPIAPCRLVDTAASPGAPTDRERQVALSLARCGRIIPSYAKAYSLVVTRMAHVAPEKLPAGTERIIETPRKVPVPASGHLAFPLHSDEILAVDVIGYYVAAGTPVSPQIASAGEQESASLAYTTPGPGPATNTIIGGPGGAIVLDASVWSPAGIYMIARAEHPWIVAQLGNADGSSAFAFTRPGGVEMLRVRSDGVMQMSSNANFFDGRTDFFGTPGASPGFVSIPTNIIHDATLLNPRDGSGGNSSRVVFFNAWTNDETGSPAISKFVARTGGFHGQDNVNFHSIVHWHMPNQFHFRATSSVENKDTFWVKAATNVDSITQTRADMYLSGRFGIGTQTPQAAAHVEDLTSNLNVILSAGDEPGQFHSPTLTLMRKDGSDAQLAKYGLRLDATDGNKFKLLYGSTGDFTAPLLTVDTSGNLTVAGNITGAQALNVVHQDVAEWVPAALDMPPGTVVVLNPEKSNEVMPSASGYDVRVAGVVSAQPGVLLGVGSDTKEMIATTGRVRVKVDATAAPIRIGDLLVSSNKAGMAMKSHPVDVAGVQMHRPGTIIGKALESLDGGEGEILVLLSLQ